MERRERMESLRSQLNRVQRQLRNLHRDIAATGDNPNVLGQAFVGHGDADDDEEYLEHYRRDPIRTGNGEGDYTLFVTDRLLTVFRMFDSDGDDELSYMEFRHLLHTGGCVEELDAVCTTEDEFKASIKAQFIVGANGGLTFEGFLLLCNVTWSDAELIDLCSRFNVELRYRCDTEQFRLLKIFQQCGVDGNCRLPGNAIFDLLFECGLRVTPREAVEIGRALTQATLVRDRDNLLNPDAEGLGGKMQEVQDASDLAAEAARKPKIPVELRTTEHDHINGNISFQIFLYWWHEVGYRLAYQQQNLAVTQKTFAARWLWMQLAVQNFTKHMRHASRIFQENLQQSIIAGVYDSRRPRSATQRSVRIVAAIAAGKTNTLPVTGTAITVDIRSTRTNPKEVFEDVSAPEGTQSFIEISFELEASTHLEGLEKIQAALRATIKRDIMPTLVTISGVLAITVRTGVEDSFPILIVTIFFDVDPSAMLEPLKAYLQTRQPPATRAMTAASTKRPASKLTDRSAKPVKAKAAVVTASRRGLARQAAEAAEAARLAAAGGTARKIYRAMGASSADRPLVTDVSLHVSSSYGLLDMFSPTLSPDYCMEMKVDGAMELDSELLTGWMDSINRCVDYFRYQAELQTLGIRAGSTTDNKDHAVRLDKAVRQHGLDHMQTGLGFFADVRTALEAAGLAGNFEKPEKGKTVPRQAVAGLAKTAWQAAKWKLFQTAVTQLTRLRGFQDIQFKWVARSFVELVSDSHLLRSWIGNDRLEEWTAWFGTPGAAAQLRSQWVNWLSAEMGRLRAAGIDEDAVTEIKSEADGDPEVEPPKERAQRLFEAASRSLQGLKGVKRVVVQVQDFRLEVDMAGMDVFRLVRDIAAEGNQGKPKSKLR